MNLRVLLVSGRPEIEESLREDPAAGAYWTERRPPELVVASEAAREFAVVLVDFDSTPDALALIRALRAANRLLEVVAIAGPESERLAVESIKGGVFDYLLWPPAEPAGLWELLARVARKVIPPEPEFPVPYGRYTLLERLGMGGMAEVFLAHTGDPPRRVVVKRMLQTLAAGEEFVRMFMDESRISSSLVHPNVVRVHDFGRVDESLYIAMEYIPGRNLEQLRLALAAPFPPAIACYIVAEICAGLGHAHSKVDASGTPMGIVHRDVNPPNVLIADDGRVMLTDFGIAKATQRYYETSSGTLKGKFEYMSPEQANGQPVDRRADIFCAGLVLYELLCGARPFQAPTPIETLFLIQECRPQPPSTWNARLPKLLDDICMKALAKDPAARYSEASELERDLREFARGSMNPGPRDLAVFAKNFGRPREQDALPTVRGAPAPASPPPASVAGGPGEKSSGVSALLEHLRKNVVMEEPAREETAAPPARRAGAAPVPPRSPRNEPTAPRRPSAVAAPVPSPPPLAPTEPAAVRPGPRRATAAVPVEGGPAAGGTSPRAQTPGISPAVAAVLADEAEEAERIGAREPEATAARGPSSMGLRPAARGFSPEPISSMPEDTVPVVLAELEKLGAPAPAAPDPSAVNTLIAPRPRAAVLPAAMPSAVPTVPPVTPETEPLPTPVATEPALLAKEITGSTELFPSSARARDRARLRFQFGLGLGGGAVLSILAAAFLFGDGPAPGAAARTPLPTATPYAAVSVAPSSVSSPATPFAPDSPPRLPPSPAPVGSPVETPGATSTSTALAMVTGSPKPTPARTAAPLAKGSLSIWVEGWATVHIDGRPAGNAPFVGLALSAGRHHVVLQNAAKARRELEVVIQPGKETRLSVDFR